MELLAILARPEAASLLLQLKKNLRHTHIHYATPQRLESLLLSLYLPSTPLTFRPLSSSSCLSACFDQSRSSTIRLIARLLAGVRDASGSVALDHHSLLSSPSLLPSSRQQLSSPNCVVGQPDTPAWPAPKPFRHFLQRASALFELRERPTGCRR